MKASHTPGLLFFSKIDEVPEPRPVRRMLLLEMIPERLSFSKAFASMPQDLSPNRKHYRPTEAMSQIKEEPSTCKP